MANKAIKMDYETRTEFNRVISQHGNINGLAELLDVSRQTVSKIKRYGEITPSLLKKFNQVKSKI